LNDADRLLLSLLDGRTDRPALAAALARAVDAGALSSSDTSAGAPADSAAAWLSGPLEASLGSLARSALIVA
jgi:hypothetical protein